VAGYVAADMVRTPWGDMTALRERRLRPGPGSPREVVRRNQQERIYAAMVASVASKGYPQTTVGDLVSLAGVSRATFYEHFSDKAECFRATVNTLLRAGLDLIENRLTGDSAPEQRGEGALRDFLELTAEQPAAARVSLVEPYSAGTAGLEPMNDAFERACELAHQGLRQLPGREGTPPDLARAVIGGLHRVLYRHLYRGEEQRLAESCDELWDWAIGFSPPHRLPQRRRARSVERSSSNYRGRDLHEGIIRSFAAVVTRQGYHRTGISQVAAEAGISNSTFYQHFENKADALIAALDLSGAQLIAATLPTARRAPAWPEALRRALEGLCAFMVSEPDYAGLRAVEVYSAGPEAIEHRDRAWEQIVEEIVPAEVREGPGPGPLAIEASGGAIYALLYERVRRNEFERLLELPPLLTYIMLTPLIGAEEACTLVAGAAARRG
jgi:AcrR family transcriptional regulator